jgi:hypothetical protein
MNHFEYINYTNSAHWKAVKADYLTRYRSCLICGKNYNLNIHHKDYTNLGHETDADLVLLCRLHHYAIHSFERRLQSDYRAGSFPIYADLKPLTNTLIQDNLLMELVKKTYLKELADKNNGWIPIF